MPTIAEALASAMGQLRSGRLREAEATLRQVAAADPLRAEAWHYLGVIACQAGQHELAAQHIHRAVQLNPDYADAHNNLGLSLQELGKLTEAAACYGRALAINSRSSGAKFNLANVFKQQGRLSEAATCYREAVAVTPEHAEAHNHLGIVLHDQGQSAEAITCYRRALELKPEFVAAYINLGVALRELGNLDEAAACYRKAIELQPGTAEAHLNLGNVLRQQQKLDEAVASYERALALKPDHAETLVLLGLAFQEQKKLAGAIASYRAALAKKPDHANALNNLGLALQEQGQIAEAIGCYQRALELSPAKHEAHFNLGNAFKEQRKLDEAVTCYERVLKLKPDHAKACNNLGIVLHDQQKPEEAAESYRLAIKLNPQFAEAYNNLGIVYKEQGKLDEAAACYVRAIALKPGRAEVHNHLGTVLHAQGKWDEAARQYGEALERKADFADAQNNLSLLYQDQGQTAEALAGFRRAIELDPDFAAVYTNLGNVLHQQGKLDEAAASLERAIELNPDSAEAHFNQSLVMLQRGDFENGWPEYEWRWKSKEFAGRALKRPTWDGSAVGGRKTVLLHTDQGFGDTLQFVRYARLVKERAKKVVLQCEKRLIPLLSRCAGLDKLVPLDAKAPASDAEAKLTSLPRAFNTTVATIPNSVPYLFADEELIEQWRYKLPQSGFKIGIAWQGNPKFKQDKARSIPLAAFAPLAEVPGVRLISLQKVQGIQQIAEARERFEVLGLGPEVDEATGAFMDTAAIMMNLDLVVTSDTAIAHLAGGLGVPVWVALSHMPEWRWMLDRSDSPWYPTMRLFRQQAPGDWASVFEEMKGALAALTVICKPDEAESHFRRGKALKERGELEAATAAFQLALETEPTHAEALNYLGIVLFDQNKLDAAIDAYRRALVCYPNYAEAHSNLGTALQQQSDLDGAIACYQRAVEIMPTFASAFYNLANAFDAKKQVGEAITSYRRALQLNPRFAEAHNNLGNVLHDHGKLDESIACYRRAIELSSKYAAAHNNLGFALQQQRKLDEAGACYRRAIELKPDYSEAHFRYATWMLLQGDFFHGFREYEWLWKTKDFRAGALGRPSWDGLPLIGSKTMLLHADQGFGDTFQFIRFAQLVKPYARNVILTCAEKLVPLLSRCQFIDKIVPHGSPVPKFDAEAYLTSLPRALQTTLDNLPHDAPYLFADPKLIEHWRKKLPNGPLKIGIAWQGNPKFLQDNTRSIPLAQFAALAEVNGVRLISLQKDLGTEQLDGVKNRFNVMELGPGLDEKTGAFMDTAAIMMNLDLVVTSDTAIAHLAGGLGVPVWLALSYMPEWRWLLDRSDSPWYPTMRLFRQRKPGDWAGVFEEISRELATQIHSTVPVANALLVALAHLQTGRLLEAEQVYRRILASEPDHADAWQFLGVIAFQRGEYERALPCIGRALELQPHLAGAHNNLGLALQKLGKLNEAAASYCRSLELKPDHAEAHNNLGNVFREQGKLDEAAASFHRAIELKLDYAEAHYNLGLTLQDQAQLDVAILHYRHALELKPNYAEVHNNLGLAFQEQKKPAEAIANYRRALELKPTFVEAQNNLGAVLREIGELDEAVACFCRVLGMPAEKVFDHELDEISHDQSVRRKRDLAAAYSNLGIIFHDERKLDEAAVGFRRALELDPECANAHFNQSLLMLQRGDFERGWPEYEWRWKIKAYSSRQLKGPAWDGSTREGCKSILFYVDQGLGDTLQFIRFAPTVKKRVAMVVVRCGRQLIPLLSRCRGIDQFISDDLPLPACDTHISLASLAGATKAAFTSFRNEVPYLFADPKLVERWRDLLPSDGFRIGIAWQGNPQYKYDARRSVELVEFAPLATVRGVRLISLQKEHGVEQISGIRDRFNVETLFGLDESSGAFMDTAAIMMNLDLVITSDTAIAHLAGGLGVPVWVALSYMPEWRWMLDRSDSPWYPTMRLFRQKSPGDWASVFQAMHAELQTLVGSER